MNEKEKMLAGILYDANNDKLLIEERIKAKDLCYDFNNLKPSNEKEKINILNKLFNELGDNSIILSPFYCDYGYNIKIGKNFFSNHNLVILDAALVKFGDNVFIGPDCSFFTAGHPIDFKRRNEGKEFAYPITVGDNVWIGGNVSVLPGVNIGSNVVIGAGSVVNKDIPEGSVAAGNLCKVIRKITESDYYTNFNKNK